MAKRNDKAAGQAAYRKLKQDLRQGTVGSLYLFHGEEAYLRDHYLDQMKAKLIPPGMESFNYHRLAGKTLTAQRLAETVDALPMMSPRTLIVVQDYDLFKAPEGERKAITQLLEDLPEYCCLVFVYDTLSYKRDARMKKLAGVLQDKGQEVPFLRQETGDLVDWIGRRFRALGHDIDTADAQYLIFLCGDLMHGLIGEIEKIGAYAQGRRVTRQDIDAVAVTYAPGLIGAVLVGLSFAKSVAYGLGVPLIPVHHVRGHIAANYLAFPELEPPFLALAISGGNTMIVDVRDYTDLEILGATRDDAAGECFDKAARVLGLPYPGGAPMDKLAQQSKGGVYTLPHSHVEGAPLDMSFSGLKTAATEVPVFRQFPYI